MTVGGHRPRNPSALSRDVPFVREVVALIVYRGPIQKAKLALLIDAHATAYGEVGFVWLTPRKPHTDRGEKFLHGQSQIAWSRLVDGRPRRFLSAVRVLRELCRRESGPIMAVGFSALPYVQRLRAAPITWCINGIPEERLLHRRTMRVRTGAHLAWMGARLGRRPDLVVTVSDPMSDLVKARFGKLETLSIPSCVNASLFNPRTRRERTTLVYLGGGQPWQGLDYLGEIWAALHRSRPELKFRVISRDQRTRRLAAGVSPQSIELVRSESATQTRDLLSDAAFGFLLRLDSLVNRVSFPTKLGEYLASGVPVVLSDMPWDPARLLRDSTAAVQVPVAATPEDVAMTVGEALDWSEERRAEAERACLELARELDRHVWASRLAAALPQNGRDHEAKGQTRQRSTDSLPGEETECQSM